MLEFIVVGEAAADVRIACALADRVIMEEGPDWLGEQSLDWHRIWSGLQPNSTHSTWGEIRQLSKGFRQLTYLRRSDAHGDKREPPPDYAPTRKAILLSALLRKDQFPAAIILVRDLDHQPERLEGMKRARDAELDKIVVLLAAPNPKREAWVLNGFNGEDEREQAELESIRQEIKFDPCREAERLRYSSQTARAERNPKEILQRLTAGSREREEKCWTETPLSHLRKRGVNTNLLAYLSEVQESLLPLFSR